MESKLMTALKKAAGNTDPIFDMVIGDDPNNQVIVHIDRVKQDATITSVVKDGVPLQETEKEMKEMLGFMLLAICFEAYENGMQPEDQAKLKIIASVFEGAAIAKIEEIMSAHYGVDPATPTGARPPCRHRSRRPSHVLSSGGLHRLAEPPDDQVEPAVVSSWRGWCTTPSRGLSFFVWQCLSYG